MQEIKNGIDRTHLMIIGYLRVSMGKQHLANQQDEIRRFAESRNLVVDHLLRK